MLIGLDFDNTIVCYDRAIADLAVEQLQIPEGVDRTKQGVRDFLRQADREDEWTRFQGHLYGPGIDRAEAYPGALDAIAHLQHLGNRIAIISHKTRHPYLGPRHDLHAAARGWIERHLSASGSPLIANDDIFLNETKDEKIDVIARLECDVFLDDLPEILTAPNFPKQTRGVLFAPEGNSATDSFPSVSTWLEFRSLCLQ